MTDAPRFFHDADADLAVLDRRRLAVLGYGNQGRAQALNLRDSGLRVTVASIEDEGAGQARSDGFVVTSFEEAAQEADVLFLLLPDEVQRTVYRRVLAPVLRAGQSLVFAHGYNIRYGLIVPPPGVDVLLLAPRMIGAGVRERFVAGGGAPAFVGVAQDASGHAWADVLALARGIGATRAGVLATTFAEETELDLYSEQAFWPAVLRVLSESYALLVERGYQPAAVLTELYRSGEPARVFDAMAEMGLFRQMRLHSHTSQFGTLTRMSRVLPGDLRDRLAERLDEIRNGAFADEWAREATSGYLRFHQLQQEALQHPIGEAELALADQLRAGQPGTPAPAAPEAS